MTAIKAEMRKAKADGEALVTEATVKRELKKFATFSGHPKIWKLNSNVVLPDEEELDTNPLDVEEKSTLLFANSHRCNFTVSYCTIFLSLIV